MNLPGWFPDFSEPMRLLWLLAVPVLVLLYVWARRQRNKRGIRFTNTGMLGAVVRQQSQWRRHLTVLLSLLSLIALTAAWAKPYAQVEVPRERATIVVVLDISQSMQATDVRPDRMTVAKNQAIDFVKTLPPQYNVALVTLSGTPAMVARPTTDRAAIIRGIETRNLQDSTAIGESIVVGLQALDQAPKPQGADDEPAPGAIVLLTDGENTNGRPADQGAALAKAAGIKIYAIGFGTENGYVDLDGKREPAPVNHDQLRRVADISEGEYFRAASNDQLKEVYADIGSSVGYELAHRETTAAWAGWGLGFGVLAALAAISLAARWPS